jgi:hypothetical protein
LPIATSCTPLEAVAVLPDGRKVETRPDKAALSPPAHPVPLRVRSQRRSPAEAGLSDGGDPNDAKLELRCWVLEGLGGAPDAGSMRAILLASRRNRVRRTQRGTNASQPPSLQCFGIATMCSQARGERFPLPYRPSQSFSGSPAPEMVLLDCGHTFHGDARTNAG